MRTRKRWIAAVLTVSIALSDCGSMAVFASENNAAVETSVSENNTVSNETPSGHETAPELEPENILDENALSETKAPEDKDSEDSNAVQDEDFAPEAVPETKFPSLHIGQVQKGDLLPSSDDTEFEYDLPVSFEATKRLVLFSNYSINAALEKGENGTLVWSILRGEKGADAGSVSLLDEEDDWTDFETVADSPYFTLKEDEDIESDYYQTAEIALKDAADANAEAYDYYIRAAFYLDTESVTDEAFYAAATVPFLPEVITDIENVPDDELSNEEVPADLMPDEMSVSENTIDEEEAQDNETDAEENEPEDILDDVLTEEENDTAQTPENTVSENSMANQAMELFSDPSEHADEPQPTVDSVGVMALSAESVTLHPGEMLSIRATVASPDSISEEIMWHSDDENIATVSGTSKTLVKGGYECDGTITAKAATEQTAGTKRRTTKITAACGGMTATVRVTVVERDENEVTDLTGDIWVDGFQKENESLVYTGQKITQDFRVYHKETLLKEKTDYTLSYKNNINAARWNTAKAPSVTITLKGQYSGSVTLYFTIYPADINDTVKENPVKTSSSDGSSTYESAYEQAVTKSKNISIPNPVMTFNKKKLAVNKDFVCDYSTLPADYKKGESYDSKTTYPYTVNGIGNFKGSYQIKLAVVDKQLNFSAASVTLDKKQYEYKGKDLTKSEVTIIKLTLNNKEVDQIFYKYEICTDGIQGSYVMVYPSEDGQEKGYRGYKKVSLKLIGDRDIKEAKVNENWKESIVFSQEKLNSNDGAGIFQEITAEKPGLLTLKTTNELLREGTDYTVKYSNAKKVGTVTVTFTGTGRYKGTLKEKYEIKPNTDSSNFTIQWKNATKENGELTIRYQKGGAVPDFVLKNHGSVLKEKTDYTVKLANNKALGAMTCEITGKGNYKGYTNLVHLTVIEGDLGLGTISVSDKPYSDKQNEWWKSKVTVKDANGKTLSAGKDYEIAYSYTTMESGKLPTAGTEITVTASGANFYKGSTIPGKYRVFEKEKNISKLQIVIDNQEYTGKEITLTSEDIHVYATAADKKSKKELPDAESFYEITEYKNNIKAGTAKVTLHGLKEYGGTKTCSFKILKKEYLKNGIKGITLDQTALEISLAEAEKRQLKATLTPKDPTMTISNPTVIWSTSNSNIATVEAVDRPKAVEGNATDNSVTATAAITVKKAGKVTITATAQDGNKTAKCTVQIEIPVLKQANRTIEGKAGDTYQLTFVGYEMQEINSEGIEFESDNPKVVSVSNQGLLTMNKFGTATIKVYMGNRTSVQQCYVIVEGEVDLTDSSVLTYMQPSGCDDDTAGINALLRQAEWSAGAYDTVYIPAGTYHIDAVSDFGGIVLTDNQTLIMSPDARLEAIANSSENSQVIFAFGRNNVTISGGQIIGERNSHNGSGGEWGHGINIAGCTNAYIKDVEVSQCWGDGIYLGLYDGWDENRKKKQYFGNGITIVNCKLHDNRRNNLSVTDVSNVTIKGCEFNYAKGKAPQYGIDIEPNKGNTCSNVTISDSTFKGNAGGTIQILGQLNAHVKGVTIENCTGDKEPVIWSGFGGSVSGVKQNGNKW